MVGNIWGFRGCLAGFCGRFCGSYVVENLNSEKVIREIVLQSKNEPYGRHNGWIVVKVTSVTDRELSRYVKEAGQRGFLEVAELTSHDSKFDEWAVRDITAPGLQFLEQTKLSRRIRLFLWAALIALIGFVAWLFPVLVSLWK
jgi:hypothetical protein